MIYSTWLWSLIASTCTCFSTLYPNYHLPGCATHNAPVHSLKRFYYMRVFLILGPEQLLSKPSGARFDGLTNRCLVCGQPWEIVSPRGEWESFTTHVRTSPSLRVNRSRWLKRVSRCERILDAAHVHNSRRSRGILVTSTHSIHTRQMQVC